jgi:hypothetical protein
MVSGKVIEDTAQLWKKDSVTAVEKAISQYTSADRPPSTMPPSSSLCCITHPSLYTATSLPFLLTTCGVDQDCGRGCADKQYQLESTDNLVNVNQEQTSEV